MTHSYNGAKFRFLSLLSECETHAKRITQAKEKCSGFFPLNKENYSRLSEDQIEHIDQLVYRFTKLQDALGAKLFPAIVAVLREDAARLTVFDVLNELERVEILSDAGQWMNLREIRNELTHDYENDPEEGSQHLNDLFRSTDVLVTIQNNAQFFVNERILPFL
jgi:hypothetical protein